MNFEYRMMNVEAFLFFILHHSKFIIRHSIFLCSFEIALLIGSVFFESDSQE